MPNIYILSILSLFTMDLSAAAVKTEILTYESSVDKTSPLHVEIAYVPETPARRKPLIVVMHGYGGSKQDVAQDIRQLAAKGVFAVAPDMRGAGNSGGKFDSGGLEVHDILDAVLFVLKKYPNEIDGRNLNIVGYSGGGGNAISCAVRFPDFFRTCVSFFGISDYAGWSASNSRPDCKNRMEAAIGTPAAEPDTYTSRNAIPAAGNVFVAKMHFFWDEAEKQCPPEMVQKFIDQNAKAGFKNCTAHISTAKDKFRWVHNYRSGNPALSEADSIFLSDILAPVKASPNLPPKGTLVVNAYLVTRNFSVWIGNGQKGSVTISYDISGVKPVVKVIDNPRKFDVQIKLTPLSLP
jgi:pimeloyl-ACP methyl ester carboxylesterase